MPTNNEPVCEIIDIDESEKRKLAYDVWNHFKKMKIDGKDKA